MMTTYTNTPAGWVAQFGGYVSETAARRAAMAAVDAVNPAAIEGTGSGRITGYRYDAPYDVSAEYYRMADGAFAVEASGFKDKAEGAIAVRAARALGGG